LNSATATELPNADQLAVTLGKDVFEAVRPYWRGGDIAKLRAEIVAIVLLVRTGYIEEEAVSYPSGMSLWEIQRQIVRETLDKAGNNKALAARMLGVDRKLIDRTLEPGLRA
jgi:DNA-binding NtrC family response regulator